MAAKRTLLTVVVSLVVGASIGYVVAQERLAAFYDDLDVALRANEFNYRLNLLKTLRHYNAKPDDVTGIEIDALILLDIDAIDKAKTGSSSRFVLEETAKRLAAYRGEFPHSEFDPQMRPVVARILSLSAMKQ